MSLLLGLGLLGGLSSWRMLVGLWLSCRRLLGGLGLLGRLNIWWIRMIRFRMGFNFEIMPVLMYRGRIEIRIRHRNSPSSSLGHGPQRSVPGHDAPASGR